MTSMMWRFFLRSRRRRRPAAPAGEFWRVVILTALASVSLFACGARRPAPPAAEAPLVVRIAAVGDIMMGTENLLPADGGAGVFPEVVSYLKDREVVLGNLEGPLTDRGHPTKDTSTGRSYVFRTPPAYVSYLKAAGFTIVTLANNHVYDYGFEGYQQTREILEEAGILHTGAPGQVARQRVGPLTVSVIGLAPNAGCQNINDIAAAESMVAAEAAKADTLVVVTFHGGAEGAAYTRVPHGPEEFLGEKRGDLRTLAHRMIEAGAALVIGHGPHVPRGLEIYHDRLIVYSLGNFATAAGISVKGLNGLAPLLLVDINSDGSLAGGKIVGFRQYQAGHPRPDPAEEAVRLMHTLSVQDFTVPGLTPEGDIPLLPADYKTAAP